jgi:hypothetical protein
MQGLSPTPPPGSLNRGGVPDPDHLAALPACTEPVGPTLLAGRYGPPTIGAGESGTVALGFYRGRRARLRVSAERLHINDFPVALLAPNQPWREDGWGPLHSFGAQTPRCAPRAPPGGSRGIYHSCGYLSSEPSWRPLSFIDTAS